MATNYRGITIELRGETTDLQRKLAQIREQAKQTFAGLREVNKTLKFDSSSVVELTQKQRYLQEAIKSTAERASAYDAALKSLDAEAEKNGGLTKEQQAQHDQLERSLEQCKRQIDEYADALQRTTADIDAHNSKLSQWGKTAETVGDNLKKAGQGMADVGDRLTQSVTVPLVAGAGVAIKAATDLDTSYHNLTKTVDGTDEELQKFKEGAVELSKIQPVSANTILDVEALGAQLGYSNESLEAFAKTVTGLDIATDMDAETAAMELAHFSNIMGMSQDQTDRYGSTIVSLGNHFATTESDVSAMALRIAGAGKQIGMSEADVLGLATALTSMGINAEAGGTAISTVMSSIDKSVAMGTVGVQQWADVAGMSLDEFIAHVSAGDDWAKEFAKSQGMTLKELSKVTVDSVWSLDTWASTAKMTSAEFAAAWAKDPVEALQAVFVGMEDATKEGSNMNLMLEDLGIKSIRQTDMMKRLASNSSLVTDAVKDANKAWKDNTALSKEVDNRNESLASKFEVLKNRATAVAAEVGKPLADALLAALDAAGPLIKTIENGAKAFANMDERQQSAIIQTLAFVAAVGPLLSILGRATEGIGSLVSGLGKVAQGIPKFASGMKQGMGAVESLNLVSEGLGTTLSTGLFAIGITAAIAAVSAFAKYLYDEWQEMERTRKSHEDFANSVKNVSDAVHGAKTEIGESKDEIKQLGDQANFTRDDLDNLTEANNRLADTIKQRNAETEQSVSELEHARGIIEAYAGQTGLGADEQMRLKEAIEKVNDQCGTSFEVFDAANGKIREQGSDAEATADQIGTLIDAQIEQVKTNALLANMEDVYKNYYDQLDKLNTIETDIKETEQQRDDALRKLNEDQAKGAAGSAEHAKEVAELNKHLGELNDSYGQVRQSVDDSVEHLDFYDQELGRISSSTDNTKTALERLVGSAAALHKKLGDDTATKAFSQQLEDLGVSASDFASLNFTQLQALADSYDGTAESIKSTLSTFGINAKATAQDAGDGIHDNLMNPVNRLPDEMDSAANSTRSRFNGPVSQMPEDARRAADASGNNLYSTLMSHNSMVSNASGSLRNSANSEVSGLPSDFDRTGSEAGSALPSSIASSMGANAWQVENEANNLASAQRGADVSGESWTYGWDFSTNMASGINDAAWQVTQAASAVAMTLVNVLGHSVPKEGPLHEGGKGEFLWGQHIVQNIVRGVEHEKSSLARVMESLADITSKSFKPELDPSVLSLDSVPVLGTLAADVGRGVAHAQAQAQASMVFNVTFDSPTIRSEQDMSQLVRMMGAEVERIRRSMLR